MSNLLKPVFLFGLIVCFAGCSGIYYDTMETMGVHKRDILADRVADARDSEEETKEQFISALEHFSSVINFQGGDLEDKYHELKEELEKSEDQAEDVRHRVAAVEDVADALFEEWEDELDQYSSASLRRTSEGQLKQTQRQYYKLIGAMKKAEAKIDPVLNPLRDQVLFLKHNLNARAITSLQTELTHIETDVSGLIRDMEIAMAEADSFIQTLKSE